MKLFLVPGRCINSLTLSLDIGLGDLKTFFYEIPGFLSILELAFLLKIYLFLSYFYEHACIYVCISVHQENYWCPCRSEEDFGIHGAGVTYNCEPPCCAGNWTPGLLQESTTKPSPQPYSFGSKIQI